MSEIRTSEPVAAWMLAEALKDPARAFNQYAPYACKLCDEPTPPAAWRRHLTAHRDELKRTARARAAAAAKNLRQISRLRKEARA